MVFRCHPTIRKHHLVAILLLVVQSLSYQKASSFSLHQLFYPKVLIPSRRTQIVSVPRGASFSLSRRRNIALREDQQTDISLPDSAESKMTSEVNSLPRKLFNVIGSTTSIVVSGTFFFSLAYRRDAIMVSFFIGSIFNAISSKVLKRVLNQDRPTGSQSSVEKPDDKGMPSSHAMSLGFIGIFVGLVLLQDPRWRLALLAYTVISLAYRIESELHTWQQIVVGAVMGCGNAILWKCLCDGTFSFNIVEWTSRILLREGVLPIPFLLVPVIVGALVVGSFERKISKLLKKQKQQ